MPARACGCCQSLDDVERRLIGAQGSTTAAAIIAVTARLASWGGRALNRACDTKGRHHLHASAWVGACDDWGLLGVLWTA